MRQFFTSLSLVALLQYFPASVLAQEKSSTNVSPAEIQQVLAANWMRNLPDGNFHPERFMSRSELASTMVKVFSLHKRQEALQEKAILVPDVPSTHPAFEDIQIVLKTDIMKGYRGNLFFPNQKVTRAEGLAIIAQAYGVFQFSDAAVNDILSAYPDATSIPDWARKAIATLVVEGFINTDAQNHISPLQPMTRGDMVYVLSQYQQRQQPQPPMPEVPPALN
ncbi:MAG: S-layer homology domain-containing protein [Nostocaceae cyanobacterium]|nr:S-layer homology domain-containing protein [Nostocaceae cyanobacterium]